MIRLKRRYFGTHTEGTLTLPDGQQIATLERPDLNNEPNESCIPEGIYRIQRDHTGRHRWFKILDVEGRTAIEIHPANKVEQLMGCIAPCMFVRDGVGYDSVTACELLLGWFGESDWMLEIRS